MRWAPLDPEPSTALWPPDWSQFIPETIVALIAGAAVGLVLWRLDVRSEARGARTIAVSSWNVLRPSVARALSVPKERAPLVTNVSKDLLPPLERPLRSIREQPIAEWATAAPDIRELELLARLLRDVPRLRHAGEDLDAAIERAYEVSGGPDPEVGRQLATALLLHQDPTTAFPPETVALHRSAVDAVLADQSVYLLNEKFDPLADRVEAEYRELRELLTTDSENAQ